MHMCIRISVCGYIYVYMLVYTHLLDLQHSYHWIFVREGRMHMANAIIAFSPNIQPILSSASFNAEASIFGLDGHSIGSLRMTLVRLRGKQREGKGDGRGGNAHNLNSHLSTYIHTHIYTHPHTPTHTFFVQTQSQESVVESELESNGPLRVNDILR